MELRARISGDAADGAHGAAAEFLAGLTAELAKGPLNLPCFPDIVPRIRQVLSEPRSSAEDLVRIAGTEPRLAARLLQTANSAIFNPGGKPAADLRQAVARLGHHLIQSVTLAFAVQQMRAEPTLRPVVKPLNDLWQKSLAVASICQVLANKLRVPADKVFLTGLLHGIGHFYILVRAANAPAGIRCEDLLAQEVTDSHPTIGRAVLQKWGFEAAVCEAVAHQNDHRRTSTRAADLTDVLVASVALAEVCGDGQKDVARCAAISSIERLGLAPSDLAAIVRHTEHTLEALRNSLGC